MRSAVRVAIIALIAVNVGGYLAFGTTSEALDATAWFALLILFELETTFAERVTNPAVRFTIRLIRIVCAAAIVAAAIRFIRERNVLDAVNSMLWIAVVLLLETEVRWPPLVARAPLAFTVSAWTLYTGLALLVPVWAVRGEWFDAYDAAMWLAAFVMVELDVLRTRSADTTKGVTARS